MGYQYKASAKERDFEEVMRKLKEIANNKNVVLGIIIIIAAFVLYSGYTSVTGFVTYTNQIEAKLNSTQLLLTSANESLNSCSVDLLTCEDKNDKYSTSLKLYQSNLSTTKSNLVKCNKDVDKCKSDITKCQKNVNSTEDELNSTEQNLKTCEKDRDEYKTSIDDVKADYNDLGESFARRFCKPVKCTEGVASFNWGISGNDINCNSGSNTMSC